MAPQAIITCAAAAADRPFKGGLAIEGKEFMKLMTGTQSKALQYMFFAQRACSKVPSLSEASASQLCRHHRLWAHGRQHRDVLRGARRHRREEPQAMNVIN